MRQEAINYFWSHGFIRYCVGIDLLMDVHGNSRYFTSFCVDSLVWRKLNTTAYRASVVG